MASIIPIIVIISILIIPSSSSLIQQTCKTTTYYDFCLATLSSDPQSSTADVSGLSAIAVAAAAANATEAAAFIASLARDAGDAAQRAVLSACAARYGDARAALAEARGALATGEYDYAFVHVSAAAEYPGVCRELFKQQKGMKYPKEVAARETGLVRLCTIALQIISLLG